MRYIEGQRPDKSVTCIVILGDGASDRRIVRAIAKKLNGENKVLHALQISLRKYGSFVASIDTIAKSIDIFGSKVVNYMLVIDKEHLNEDFEKKLR